MEGKKWKLRLAVGLLGLAAVGMAAGCGGAGGSDGKMKVGVVQIVQHPALDEANKGFVEALEKRGLKDKIEIDQQNVSCPGNTPSSGRSPHRRRRPWPMPPEIFRSSARR